MRPAVVLPVRNNTLGVHDEWSNDQSVQNIDIQYYYCDKEPSVFVGIHMMPLLEPILKKIILYQFGHDPSRLLLFHFSFKIDAW